MPQRKSVRVHQYTRKSCGNFHAYCYVCRPTSLGGYTLSDETKKRQSINQRRHASLNLPSCNCFIHQKQKNPSNLSWKMVDFLVEAGFDIVIPEVQLGGFSVDALLAEEWVAFEADGEYWHRDRQENDSRRDEYLLEEFNLPVVRLTQAEIGELV